MKGEVKGEGKEGEGQAGRVECAPLPIVRRLLVYPEPVDAGHICLLRLGGDEVRVGEEEEVGEGGAKVGPV